MRKSNIVCLVLLFCVVGLGIGIHVKKNSLYDQQAAIRWSSDREMEQMSLIYPITMTEGIDDFYFKNLTHQIQDALDKSAFSQESGIPDEEGITFPYSVSIEGKLTIEGEGKSVETTAIGVEGSFFIFHPVNLLYGSYLSGDELMQDGIIIDDDTAWKLFGSSDVVGKMVTISGVPHYIKGVFHKDEGKIAEAAGLDSNLIFASLNSLQYGSKHGSFIYELILPNPVEDFAAGLVKNTVGNTNQGIEFVDNSTRFSSKQCLGIINNIGVRSMSRNDIVYPYYENEARAFEDIFAIVYGVMYTLAVVLIIIVVIKLWLYKTRLAKRRRNYEKERNPYIASIRTFISRRMREKGQQR